MPRRDPSLTKISGPWRHIDVRANGIRFHCVEALADSDEIDTTTRPLVLMLHGFGSFWWSWRHQLRALRGARVVAVDLRGYGGTDKPPRGYDGWTLAGDTAGIIRALGHNTAIVVGHGDGGLVGWATALLHSRLVSALALVSSPHPVALRAATMRCCDQARALLPTLLRYQLPFLPERSLTRDNASALELFVRQRVSDTWSASQDFSETISYMRQAIQIPAAAHSALEYQRWAVRSQFRSEGWRFMRLMNRDITVPLLHIRGQDDPYILHESVDRTQRYAPHGRYVTVAGAGHFVHEEAPDEVTQHVNAFLLQVHSQLN